MSGTPMKDDAAKPMLHLLHPGWVWEIGEVLSHGARKYEPNGWKNVAMERYISALLRHSLEVATFQQYDSETGLSHLAHIGCNAMFLHYFMEGPEIPTRRCQCEHCR